MPALADTTILSNFAQVRRPDLLRSAHPDLAVPGPVWSELDQGVRRGFVPACDWSWLRVLNLDGGDLDGREHAHAEELGRALGAGEAACLAIAHARGWLFLSDDRDARRQARALGLAVSGTLGTLARLVDRRALDLEEADALLAAMVRRGFYSPAGSLGEILERG